MCRCLAHTIDGFPLSYLDSTIIITNSIVPPSAGMGDYHLDTSTMSTHFLGLGAECGARRGERRKREQEDCAAHDRPKRHNSRYVLVLKLRAIFAPFPPRTHMGRIRGIFVLNSPATALSLSILEGSPYPFPPPHYTIHTNLPQPASPPITSKISLKRKKSSGRIIPSSKPWLRESLKVWWRS